jgi:hypothetical protein
MEKKIKELLGSGIESRAMENDVKILEILRKARISELTKEDFYFLKSQLNINKKKLFFYYLLNHRIYPDKINITPNSSNFDLLCNNFDLFRQLYPNIKINYYYLSSNVEINNKIITTLHNSIEITLPSGSFLRISPTIKESIEITFIRVEKENHSKGEGTLLMKTITDYMTKTLGYRPRLVLECIGSVGSNNNIIEIGIKKQTAFFRKFGFRVENGKHYPHYVMMSSPKSEINLNEEQFKLAA